MVISADVDVNAVVEYVAHKVGEHFDTTRRHSELKRVLTAASLAVNGINIPGWKKIDAVNDACRASVLAALLNFAQRNHLSRAKGKAVAAGIAERASVDYLLRNVKNPGPIKRLHEVGVSSELSREEALYSVLSDHPVVLLDDQDFLLPPHSHDVTEAKRQCEEHVREILGTQASMAAGRHAVSAAVNNAQNAYLELDIVSDKGADRFAFYSSEAVRMMSELALVVLCQAICGTLNTLDAEASGTETRVPRGADRANHERNMRRRRWRRTVLQPAIVQMVRAVGRGGIYLSICQIFEQSVSVPKEVVEWQQLLQRARLSPLTVMKNYFVMGKEQAPGDIELSTAWRPRALSKAEWEEYDELLTTYEESRLKYLVKIMEHSTGAKVINVLDKRVDYAESLLGLDSSQRSRGSMTYKLKNKRFFVFVNGDDVSIANPLTNTVTLYLTAHHWAKELLNECKQPLPIFNFAQGVRTAADILSVIDVADKEGAVSDKLLMVLRQQITAGKLIRDNLALHTARTQLLHERTVLMSTLVQVGESITGRVHARANVVREVLHDLMQILYSSKTPECGGRDSYARIFYAQPHYSRARAALVFDVGVPMAGAKWREHEDNSTWFFSAGAVTAAFRKPSSATIPPGKPSYFWMNFESGANYIHLVKTDRGSLRAVGVGSIGNSTCRLIPYREASRRPGNNSLRVVPCQAVR